MCGLPEKRCESRLHFIVVAAAWAVKMTELRLRLNWHTLSGLSMRVVTGLLVVFGLCSLVSRSPAAIVLSGDDTYAHVAIGLTTNTDQQLNSGTGANAHALFSLVHESLTKSTFTSTFLHGSYIQSRPGQQGSVSLGYYSGTFSVSVNSIYQVLGNITNADGLTHFHLHLYDNTTSSYLFVNEQVSDGVGANFTYGQTTGNVSNILTGNASGPLLTSHSYTWYALAYTQALSAPDFGSSLLGSAALLVTELPEQSSLVVWSVLAVAIGGVCWWKRGNAAV
jgi:hypothetical protein